MDAGEDHGENGSEGGAQPDEEGKEEPPQGAEEELMTPGADRAGEGADIEEEAETQRALRDPGLPSRDEKGRSTCYPIYHSGHGATHVSEDALRIR